MTDSAGYDALTREAGVVDFRDRALVEVFGPDAVRFLHNFCTNDIQRLQPGQGCEAFVTSVQGKILGHIIVSREPDRIVLESVPGAAEKLIPHLDRYLIREQVTLKDRSQAWGEILLAGANSPALLSKLLPHAVPQASWESVATSISGRDCVVQRADPILAEPAFLLRMARDDFDEVNVALIKAGGAICSAEAFEMARIEAGWPLYGRDITEQNLPQEVDRNAQAISFRKGCYLGQETVARIDALGHVNRTLRGLKFAGTDVPPVGTELFAGEKPIGEVASSTWSPKLNAPLALGYLRRGHDAIGKGVSSAYGEAITVSLPV